MILFSFALFIWGAEVLFPLQNHYSHINEIQFYKMKSVLGINRDDNRTTMWMYLISWDYTIKNS